MTTKRVAKPAKPAKPVHGDRKNAARRIYARVCKMDDGRGRFIAGAVAAGATDGTARVWWQQFRSGTSPVKVA